MELQQTRNVLFRSFRKDLTTGDVARICGVSPQTVINWCVAGKLQFRKLEGGHHRIPRAEVRALLTRCNIPVPPDLKAD